MSNPSAKRNKQAQIVAPYQQYTTHIGLDVHARTIAAFAINKYTGECEVKAFRHDEFLELVSWIDGFDKPHVVYESGVTGFALYRQLKQESIDVDIVAVSKIPKSVKNKVTKTDKHDAKMLAQYDMTNILTKVFVPDEFYEKSRDLCRVLDQTRDDLQRARQRLSKFLLTKGYVFSEKTSTGNLKGTWTRAHWKWIDSLELKGYEDVLDHFISEARHFEREKKRLEALVVKLAQDERLKERVEALSLIKGISTVTAVSLVSEVAVFSRFGSAKHFMAYLGLVPSEYSSGEHQHKGAITKCGNKYLRKLLVESSWHYMRVNDIPKRPKENSSINLLAQRIAKTSTIRLSSRFRHLLSTGHKSVVANCAVARELAGFVWAIACACEGTLTDAR